MGKSASAKSKAVLRVTEEPGKSHARHLADLAASSTVQAASIIEGFTKNIVGAVDVTDLYDALAAKHEPIAKGDLGNVEGMLLNQALALQSIFTSMARRASNNASEYVQAADIYLRLALKAQAQCRATLETLAEIKNPQPTAFIRQQNIAANQQVNNHAAPSAPPARTEDSGNQTNELLAVTHEQRQRQRLDVGTPTAASAGDPAMAAVDAIDRA